MKRTSWPRRKFPNVKGALQVRPQAGAIIASKWPRRRPSPRHPINEYWSEWLRQATALWMKAPSEFQVAARKAARGTPQMPRDLFIAAARGRLWYLAMPDGRKVFPMCAVRDVSASLDVLGQLQGQMLYRNADLWVPLDAPSSRQLLTFDIVTGLPIWADQAPPAVNYTPPVVADFPTIVGSSTPTLVQSTTGPIVFGRNAATAFQGAAALRTLASAPHTWTAALKDAANWTTSHKFGLALRDSGTGKIVLFAVTYQAPTAVALLGVDYWNSLTAYSSTPIAKSITHQTNLFFRIVRTSTTFEFLYSTDDANYQSLGSLGHTAHLATPNQIGLATFSGSVTESMGSALTCYHWHHE